MSGKDDMGRPLEQHLELKQTLKRAQNYLDIEGEERPNSEEREAEPEIVSEPDKEATPESGVHVGEDLDLPDPAELFGPGGPTVSVPALSEAEQESMSQNVEIPVPDEGAGDELMFGDELDVDEALQCGAEVCWEIDITPPMDWSLLEELDEEMICMASEGRKKRVEVRLRDLTLKDQRRFASARSKEAGAWISHKTVKRVVGNIMRCLWIYTWKTADGDLQSPDSRKTKARSVVLGFEDPDIDWVPNDAPTLKGWPPASPAEGK